VVPEKQGLKLGKDGKERGARRGLSSGSRKTRIETEPLTVEVELIG